MIRAKLRPICKFLFSSADAGAGCGSVDPGDDERFVKTGGTGELEEGKFIEVASFCLCFCLLCFSENK